jgi:dTDP-3-amino-3,4,6-trideoxy-alpha-D-glucose transaminase
MLPQRREPHRALAPNAETRAPFVRLIDLQLIPMPNGVLGVAEVSKHIGFAVHRMYFIKDVPPRQGRGGHGHKALRQCFVCLRGSVDLVVTKDGVTERLHLTDTQAAVVDAGCWRDLNDFTNDAVVIVLASDEYDEADYIRDRAAFAEWEAGRLAIDTVPYLDLRRYEREVGPQIELAIRRVLKSGALIGGPELAAFETSFAAYCGAEHMVGVGNGLDALVLALRAWGVGPGDEVICPAHTFVATALAIDQAGATPVLVDVEPDTGLMDVAKVAAAITPKTRAVIPVHLYGHPVDMDGLRAAIGSRDIRVLEDSAQAHGALYKGSRCGALGDAAAFSFYPTKNLGALGDGGAVTTTCAETARRVRRLSNYGSDVKYRHEELGTNSRLDPLQAAVLGVKLARLDAWNARRSQLALRYFLGLAHVRQIALPAVRPWAEPVWHVFPIRAGAHRDALKAHLEAHGIGVNIHYPTPVHLQPCYAGRWRAGDFPAAEALGTSLLSLPLDPFHSEPEIELVIRRIVEFFGEAP